MHIYSANDQRRTRPSQDSGQAEIAETNRFSGFRVVRDHEPQSTREEIGRNLELWIGCLAGALEEKEYKFKLAAAGFVDIELEVCRVYDADITGIGDIDDTEDVSNVNERGRFISAFIRALKPNRACCDPGCCG